MKKFFIILLSFFCLAYSPFIECSQEDFQRRAQAATRKLPAKDQAKIADIQRRHAAGEQLTFDDNEFIQSVEAKIIKIMKDDEEAEAQQAQELENAKKERAQAAKDKNKNKLAEFISQPQGPCPYDETQDTEFIDILDNVINLDAELAAGNSDHQDLETTLACNDSVYNATSIAKSPYDATKTFIDGTIVSLKIAGKNICNAKTGPENEFQIQATQSQTNPDEYEVVIDGYTVCNNLDTWIKPAHNNLAQKIYQHIGKTQKEDSSTMQGSIEGKRYPGMLTSCSDAKVKITCSKELLKYLVKKKYAPKKSSIEKYSDYRNAFCAQRQKEIDQEVAEQDAYNQKIVEQKQQFARDRKEWEAWWNGSKKSNPAQQVTTNQADHKTTDMQQLQQEESNKAR